MRNRNRKQRILGEKIIIAVITAVSAIIAALISSEFFFPTVCKPSDPSPSSSLSLGSSTADTPSLSSKLYPEPSAETEKWGYVDGNDNIIIPFIYDWADDFIDGYAAVCLNGKYGFIDKSGNEMIAFNYNMAWSFMDGLAPVYNGDKWGFIDENGILKIPFKYTIISRSTFLNGKQAYIDENDNVIDYDKEMSSANLSPVPVGNIISPYVSAYRNGSKLTVMINKGLHNSKEDIEYPFKWGLELKDNLNENYKFGECTIDIMLSANEDGTIAETDSRVLISIEGGGYNTIKEHLFNVSADFDGENYVVTCDIANDYIDFDKICVVRHFYY